MLRRKSLVRSNQALTSLAIDEFGDAEFADEEFADVPVDEFGAADDLGRYQLLVQQFSAETGCRGARVSRPAARDGQGLVPATAIETLKIVNDGDTPGTFFLSILYKRLPESVKSVLFDPYMSSDGNQVRFSVRVFESDPESASCASCCSAFATTWSTSWVSRRGR